MLPDRQYKDDEELTVIAIPRCETLDGAKVCAYMYFIEYGVECSVLEAVYKTTRWPQTKCVKRGELNHGSNYPENNRD
ncbi:MAG: hypothetical protein H3Z53_04730 [archaeon]|nr:hypothetical protein [archaeon]